MRKTWCILRITSYLVCWSIEEMVEEVEVRDHVLPAEGSGEPLSSLHWEITNRLY
jgi:hypothetical protein